MSGVGRIGDDTHQEKPMRRFAMIALGIALCGGASACDDDNNGPSQQPVVFTAQLLASNETPARPTGSEANGQGSITITFDVPRDASGNPTGNGTWTIQAVLSGLSIDTSIRLGHIHTGASGVAGPVFVGTSLSAANAVAINVSGTINLTNMPITQAEATAVMANPSGHYFNFHSAAWPAGVVRGQLQRQ